MYWPAPRFRFRRPAVLLPAACIAASLGPVLPAAEARGQRVDRGAFRLLVNGQEVGAEEFEIQWRGEGDAQRTMAKGTVAMRDGPTLVTTLLAVGRTLVVRSYQALHVAGGDTLVVTLERTGGRRLDARTLAPWGEEVRGYRAPPSTVILEEGVAHHYFVLEALLRGPSPPLHLLSPVSQEKAAADVDAGQETIHVDGESIATTRVRLNAEDGARLAWFDGSGRLVRVEVPARGFVAERVLGTGGP